MLEIASQVTDEPTITVGDEVSFKSMDASKIVMIKARVPPDKVEIKREDDEENIRIAIRVSDVKKALSRMKGEVEVEVDVNKLTLTGEDEKVRKKYDLKLLEASTSDVSDPKPVSKASFKTTIEKLLGWVKDAEVVNNVIEFSADKKSLIISTKGDNGEMKVEIDTEAEEADIQSLEVKEKSRAKYSTDYMNLIKSAKGLGDEITVEFAEEAVMKIKSKNVEFYIAPRRE